MSRRIVVGCGEADLKTTRMCHDLASHQLIRKPNWTTAVRYGLLCALTLRSATKAAVDREKGPTDAG
jgi:hypothetical protein